jgi:pimeloyl-ACP methyl ester carboxylesterase
VAVRTLHVNNQEFNVAYERLGNPDKPAILILHGWGASRVIMQKAFSKTLPEFCHYYVDLPGFGQSNLETPMDSYGYANVLKEWCEALHVKPQIIIGHSFGGKIATLLNPPNLVLLSSAGIVPQKSFKVRAKIALFKFFKKLGFGRLYTLFASKDVAGMDPQMYETFKKVVDEDFTEDFASFSGKAHIFWGEEDRATPLKSGEKIHHIIKNSQFYPLRGDHFFFLLHAEFIAKTIKENGCL